MIEKDIDEILDAIEAIDGIVLLDLSGVQSTWKQHIDDLYRRVNLIRAICEGNDDNRELYRDLIRNS